MSSNHCYREAADSAVTVPLPNVPSDPVIVEDLRHEYDEGGCVRRVLSDVSLRIAAGEIVVVAGAPGSGKSTLLSLIGGWQASQIGRVCVLGTELTGASPRTRRQVRRRIGLVAQTHAKPETPSSNESVMLTLVLAFAAAPPLLLADEPTVRLDDPTRCRIGDLLRQFARESAAAVLVATEDPAILAVADRVLRLEHGALAGLAEPERTTIVYRHSA